jgi:hypothetical protein
MRLRDNSIKIKIKIKKTYKAQFQKEKPNIEG